MSAITKQIAAVEFHVNARQANAALESMRQSAEDAREEMSQLQEQANKGVKTVMVGGKDMDITKRIRDLNATAKAFEQAAQSQIKGVKAWDELWQHAKMGNIEQLTGQQIKAGVNGAKRQYDRLILGDEEDRRKAAAIRDIIDQANIVLDKLKGDTDKVIQTLSDGGHVADEVLQREKKNLEDMLSLTEKFSPEWQDYNRQLQAITKGIEEQAAQEKRLRGELVDANDARREAAKLDEDVARAAKKEHTAQQQKIDDAQKQMQQYQEERRQHQETAQKITDEIAKQDRQIASQSQLVESIKRENHERTKKSNVMVQEADQADKTAAKAKRAADSSVKVVEKFSDKLQKAKDDVAKLQEQLDKLGSTTETPKVDTSKIDALKKQIEGLKAEYKQLSSDWIKASLDREPHKMYASYEDFAKEAGKKKGYDFEMDEDQYLEKMRKRRAAKFKDMVGDEVFGSDAYLRIKDIAAGHTEEDDLIGPKQAKTILAGQKAYSDACDKATGAIIQAHANLRRAFDDNLQPEQVQNIAKQLHKLQELYAQLTDIGFSRGIGFGGSGKDVVKDMFEGTGTDFDKEVSKAEAQIKRTLTTAEKQKYDYYDKTFEKERTEAKQKQEEIDKRQEQIKKDLANAERDLANAEKEHSAESAKSNSEREAVVIKLTKALEKQSKAEEDLKQKEKEAADAQEMYNRANADAVAKHEALDKAKAEGNKKLQEESQKLSQLQGTREANVASLNQEKEAIKQKNEAVDAQAKIINDAQQTQAKSRQLSIESIEKSIALLKQENRVIGDETNPQWVENEKTIGRLNRRLEEMNANAAELRRQAGVYNYIRENISDTKKVSDDALRSMYNELQKTNGAGRVSTQVMRENKQAMREIRAEQERRVQKVLGGDLGRQNEIQIRNAIAGARELIQAYGTTSRRAQTLAAQIVNAEAHLKTVGVEGARAARREADAAQLAADKYKLMQDHMKNLGRISQSAFKETQKFWKEQLDGATKGSRVYKEATRNLKALAAEQQRMATEQLQRNAKQLNRKDLGRLSEQELQSAIAAGKQLAQSMKPTDQAYKDLVNNIIRAEKYVKEFGLEGQRSARRTAEQMDAMNDRMSKLNKLSDGALEETRKFWQEQMNGAERGSKAYKEYEANLKAVIDRQREITMAGNQKSANKLMAGESSLKRMGEEEIRKAISAAREYQKTLQADSDAYTGLSRAIFNAEEYLRKYGYEADKAKMKEEQLKAAMTDRMKNVMTLSDSALAETKKFWQAQMEGAARTSSEYKEAEANLQRIAETERNHKAASGMRVMSNLGNYGDAEIRQAIKAMEELRDAQAHGSKEWNRYNNLVEQGKKHLEELAQTDSLSKFEGQMRRLSSLSDSALAGTKKFWQEMVMGADKGSVELKKYEAQLEKVKQEESKRAKLANEMSVQKLGGDLSKLSESEIRQAIEAGKQLIQAYGTTSRRAQTLAAQIVNAEAHLKTVGVEGARAARREADAAQLAADKYKLMQDHMKNLGRISQSAFTETQKFWKEQLDGATKGSRVYKEATRNLKALAAEQQRMATEQLQRSAKQLSRKDFSRLSEQELQSAIAAGKQLAQSMKPTDQTYKDLVNNIIRAEKYVKEFGLEGQRSASRTAEQMDAMNDRMSKLYKLSDGALEETRKFWQEQMNGAERGSKAYKEYEANLNAVIARQQKIAMAGNLKSVNKLMAGESSLKGMGEDEIRKAISAAREYQKTLQADSDAYTGLSRAIFNAEQYLRKYGYEADKAKMKEEQLKAAMTDRMKKVMTLSGSALAETKKFWQAQKEGAARTSSAYKEAEANLQRIAETERNHKAASGMRVMANLDKSGDAEIRQAIKAMEELRDAQAHGSKEWNHYNNLVEQGKKHLEEWAQTDSLAKFEGQMQKLTSLSDSALAETKKFWQEMVAGTAKGSAELKEYEDHLAKVKQEESERRQLANEMSVQKLGGDLSKLSESEIRQAIEAGKQLIQTYATASPEAKSLAAQIVNAERHLKQYGVEAERAAVREAKAIKKAADERAKADQMMETQLQNASNLTDSALKAQEHYWQRLIDDPKTAASSLSQYKDNLEKVHLAQQLLTQDKGQTALDFFRNGTGDASAEQIKEQAENLKRYRDTLPTQSNADVILEINRYLAQTGQAAGSSAAQMMSLQDALFIGKQGLAGSFKGTTEQLRQAKQVLESTLATTAKGSDRYKEIREALAGIAVEEKRVGEVSAEVQKILDEPKGRSFNELKVAVEQGRKELNSMTRTTKEGQKAYDELAEKVKAADLELKELGNDSKGTQSSFEKAWSRLKTYVTLYMGTAVALQKISGAADDMLALSDKMGEVRKTTGFSADEVGRLSNNLAKLDTRTPIQNLMDLSAAAGQLGLNTEDDVRGFTEAANKMLVALPEMGEDGATEMMKIAIATKEVDRIRKEMENGTVEGSSATAVAMEKIASTIDRLRATTAAAAPPIADFVKRVGAVGAQSGITVDQVAALGATVDSLGMGTEMAATAISRMIPAIKNNAFDIAHAIGVTPETIRNMYESGHAMDVILMILQHIKEENLNPDGIEKLLGSGGMGEIMKELNQQGARAGIVFAGLSQNVDELRKNLGTAKEAYADNVAIQQEYDKMNETAAAKWERLKNEIEEVFVNDTNQNFMSTTLDFLRALVDFLTGRVNPVLKVVSYSVKAFALAWAAAKSNIGTIIGGLIKKLFHLDRSIRLCTASFKKFYAANKANVWFAIATAVFYVVSALHSAYEESQEFERELARLDAEELEAERDLDKLVEGFNASSRTADAAASKQAQLKAQTSDLRKEVNELSKSTNKSSETTAKLHAKQEQLRQKERQLKQATDACNTANGERLRLIGEINSKYSKYLGYMLNERTAAEQVAIAHLQIVDALRQELEQKRLNKKIERIDNNSSKAIERFTKDSNESIRNLPAGVQRNVEGSMNYVFGKIRTYVDKQGNRKYYLPALKGYTRRSVTGDSMNDLRSTLREVYQKVLTNQVSAYEWTTDRNGRRVRRLDRNGKPISLSPGWNVNLNPFSDEAFGVQSYGSWRSFADNTFERHFWKAEAIMNRESQIDDARLESQQYTRGIHSNSVADANSANASAIRHANATLRRTSSKKKLTNEQITNLAQQASIVSANLTKFKGELRGASGYGDGTLKATINKMYPNLTSAQREQILRAAERTQAGVDNGGDGTTFNPSTGGSSGAYTPEPSNPWGDHPDAATTNWSKMNGKDLVARRKQMNEFVLALQGDTDVESVLSEDPALMAAMKKGKVKKDANSVIAWYDKQRLAIQDVLHSRALTNTGNWKDPKVAHQRAKSISAMVKNDMSYYMDELDAYYTEQKSQIEDAQNSGLITEEEGWRRLLENDRIWRQRRAELQQLYAGKTKEVTQQEADNIYSIIAERTGDSADFIKVNIGKTNDLIHQAGLKNVSVERRILGDLDKGTEQDFLKMRTAVKKQLDAIEEIVSKERPFDGIVKNLRQNVEKMGIIYTDLDKQKEKLILSGKGNGSDEMKALNEEYAKERPNRLTFLLKESENAYQKTGDTLLSDMRANGFSSWADAITQSDDADKLKEALVAQLHTVYDSVQDAIKKEASEVKKQVDIAWNDTNVPLIGGKSMKNLYEAAANALGVEQQSVSRANSLIGAGAASERVADKLAIRQLQIQLNMQEHYYALVRKIGQQRVDDLKRQEEQYRKQGDYAKAEEAALDAKHAKMSLNLTLSEEETDLAKQRAEINARVEESQNRLYTSLKEWGTLLSSSMQSLFEASNTGAADYYNNLAKMRLTGEGSAGGTYVIIDNAGTKDAQAHYENLDGEDALKRQLEIEQQNAVADAWKKVMDDINKKISDQITDWMNAALQTQSIDANTAALEANTAALYATRPKNEGTAAPTAGKWEMGKDENGNTLYPLQPTEEAESGDLSTWPNARRKRAGLSADGKYDAPAWQLSPLQQEDEKQHNTWTGLSEYGGGDKTQQGASPLLSDDQMTAIADQNMQVAQSKIDASNAATEAVIAGNKAQLQSTKDTGGKMEKTSKSTFSVMAQAMNMYGLAYQVMSNENMSSTQKFLTFALQSAGQVAIAMLTTNMLQTDAQSKVELPGILGKAASQLGPIAGPIAFAAMTALLGGLMAVATSKVSKSKSQISQVTGASVSAGRLSTGMLTYATGNVNEFTDPSTLTPGQQYNVDAADGHTYRARYMGANPKTHLTNGPEFHLVGERGREAIIDANTTRQLQMDDTGIWQAIQTLYNGGSIRSVRRGGMKAFATGNIDELGEGATAATSENGTAPVPSDTDLLAALQASLDRNTEVMQKAVEHGIKGVFNVYGKDGLIDSYDRGKKNANRYGERY